MSTPLVSPTLGKLISSVRGLLNQPNPANSFWSDSELTDYINEGIRMYFAEITRDNEGQFTKTADLDIVSGVETVSTPTDFFEARAMYISQNGNYTILPYANNIIQSYSNTGGTDANSYNPSYYFRSQQIVLRPIPNFSATGVLRLEYMYFPDTMINGGDAMNNGVSPVFKQLIEMYAVSKAKLKESLTNGTDTGALARQNLAEIYALFKDTIRGRSKYPTYTVAFNPEGEN